MDFASVDTPAMWALPEVFECLETDDAAELMADLVEVFRSDTARRLRNLRSAIAVSDLTLARAEAHSIKGSARQMGAEALAAACQEIESKIVQAGAPLPAGCVDRLEFCFCTASLAMSNYAGSL